MPDVRAFIVDDEPLVREGLRAFAERDGRVTVVGEAKSGVEAVPMLRRLRPDLLLLDVQMPELDGFGVVEELGDDVPPAVIFVTAFDEYAVRAFDAHAVDYLLKPFEESRFTTALSRALQRLEGPERLSPAGWRRTIAELRAPAQSPRRFLVKEEGRVLVVPADEIEWVEAADNYVRLHTRQRSWMLRESMQEMELQLCGNGFARAHRSAIVNLARVRELQPLFGGEYVVILASGARVTLSRGYRDAFRAQLTGG
jgi:two-component system LytT family response regulator